MTDQVQAKKGKSTGAPGGGDAVYAFGIIGAMVFYIQEASGVVAVLIAILKAFVWPAFFVYDVLKFIT